MSATEGSRVMVETPNRRRHPRVVHRLERIKESMPSVLYPYVMVCGYATSAVVEAPEDVPEKPCGKCWKEKE